MRELKLNLYLLGLAGYSHDDILNSPHWKVKSLLLSASRYMAQTEFSLSEAVFGSPPAIEVLSNF